jgi:TolB protein
VGEAPNGRQRLVPLDEVDAPYPLLQDLADESFMALRRALATRIGWDYLSTLENAFVPLTSPLFPGMLDDWLYSGRAFALNPAPASAGWLVVVREDYGPSTYWRLYLRTRFQDGSQGRPLHQVPWNLAARYSGDPRAYEAGGAPMATIPPGYWLDFTDLAASYGWERLPALSTWRAALPAARYNEFVLRQGLDWYSAMREIYPEQALYTPTPIQPPTYTPTPTRRPTRTPTPTRTPWPSRTPTPSRTPPPTSTATPHPSTPSATP